jgi:hypothetical protein
MAETFEEVAARIFPGDPNEPKVRALRGWITEALTEAWNARGQADIDAAVTRMSTLVGWASSEPYLNHIRKAIEALDR